MSSHDFTTISVGDGTEMDSYIALPEGKGPFPGLILLQEAFGVNRHIRRVAEELCKEGYAVAAPDLFHRTGRRVDIPYTNFALAAPHFQAVSKAGLQDDLKATHTWLQQQPAVSPGKIGSIGFCLGGRVSFLANLTLPLAVAVSYYGGGLDALAGEAGNLHAAHLFLWGGMDKHITLQVRDTIVQAVDQAGKEYMNVVISYADHAFNCDERPSYQPEAAREAWALSLAFLANRLKDGK
jgi:carboxymethylenebutenolidase